MTPGTPSMNGVPAPDYRQYHASYSFGEVVVDACTLTILIHSVPVLEGEQVYKKECSIDTKATAHLQLMWYHLINHSKRGLLRQTNR